MHLQYAAPSSFRGDAQGDLPVKPASPSQRWVQGIWPVGGTCRRSIILRSVRWGACKAIACSSCKCRDQGAPAQTCSMLSCILQHVPLQRPASHSFSPAPIEAHR